MISAELKLKKIKAAFYYYILSTIKRHSLIKKIEKLSFYKIINNYIIDFNSRDLFYKPIYNLFK